MLRLCKPAPLKITGEPRVVPPATHYSPPCFGAAEHLNLAPTVVAGRARSFPNSTVCCLVLRDERAPKYARAVTEESVVLALSEKGVKHLRDGGVFLIIFHTTTRLPCCRVGTLNTIMCSGGRGISYNLNHEPFRDTLASMCNPQACVTHLSRKAQGQMHG